jgi:hypothetical protein
MIETNAPTFSKFVEGLFVRSPTSINSTVSGLVRIDQ